MSFGPVDQSHLLLAAYMSVEDSPSLIVDVDAKRAELARRGEHLRELAQAYRDLKSTKQQKEIPNLFANVPYDGPNEIPKMVLEKENATAESEIFRKETLPESSWKDTAMRFLLSLKDDFAIMASDVPFSPPVRNQVTLKRIIEDVSLETNPGALHRSLLCLCINLKLTHPSKIDEVNRLVSHINSFDIFHSDASHPLNT